MQKNNTHNGNSHNNKSSNFNGINSHRFKEGDPVWLNHQGQRFPGEIFRDMRRGQYCFRGIPNVIGLDGHWFLEAQFEARIESEQPQPDPPQPAPPPPQPPPLPDTVSQYRSRLSQLKNKAFQPGQHKSYHGGRPPQSTPQPQSQVKNEQPSIEDPEPAPTVEGRAEDLVIHRAPHDKEHPYTRISNASLRDCTLSWEARGLHHFLLSNRADFTINVKTLFDKSPGGRDAVYTIINELIEARYMVRRPIKQSGKFVRWDYIVYETPLPEKPEMDSSPPLPEKPEVVNSSPPLPEKPEVVNSSPPPTKPKKTKTGGQVTDSKEFSPLPEKPEVVKMEAVPLPEKPLPEKPDLAKPDLVKPDAKQIISSKKYQRGRNIKEEEKSSSSDHDHHVAAGEAVMMMMEKFGFSQKEAEGFARDYPLKQITSALARWDEIDQSGVKDPAAYGASLIRKGSKPGSTNRQLQQSSPSETPEETKARLQAEQKEFDKEMEMMRSAIEHFKALPIDIQEEMFREFKKYMVKKYSYTEHWSRETFNGPFEVDLFRRFDGQTFTERREG